MILVEMPWRNEFDLDRFYKVFETTLGIYTLCCLMGEGTFIIAVGSSD